MKDISKNDFIRFLIEEEALRFGTFTLKSGMRSPFFINLGDVSSGKGLHYLGHALAGTINKHFENVDILFGPPYKGITLISAAAIAYNERYNKNISICYNRKEIKAHGEQGLFIGKIPKKENRVIVIDDVLSTGGTKLETIKLIEDKIGLKLDGIVVTVDRRTKDAGNELDHLKIYSIVNLLDVVSYLEQAGDERAQLMQKFYEGTYE